MKNLKLRSLGTAISAMSLLSIAPTKAQGLLGESKVEMDEPVEFPNSDLPLVDTRTKLLRMPNLSHPPCYPEVGRSLDSDLRAKGLQVVSRLKLADETVAVVAQVGQDQTSKSIDGKMVSLFENMKYVFLVHFPYAKLGKNLNKYQYLAFDPKFGNVPGLAIRPRDRKFVLATQKFDLDRIDPDTNSAIQIEKVTMDDYRSTLYPRYRVAELEYFKESQLPKIEREIRGLEHKDTEYREIFKAKVKDLQTELNACRKML